MVELFGQTAPALFVEEGPRELLVFHPPEQELTYSLPSHRISLRPGPLAGLVRRADEDGMAGVSPESLLDELPASVEQGGLLHGASLGEEDPPFSWFEEEGVPMELGVEGTSQLCEEGRIDVHELNRSRDPCTCPSIPRQLDEQGYVHDVLIQDSMSEWKLGVLHGLTVVRADEDE